MAKYSPDMTGIDRRIEEMLEDWFIRGQRSIQEELAKADFAAIDRKRRAEEDEILERAERIKAARAAH